MAHNELMTEPFTPPAIVVGIDGARAGLRAALWAVDEAVGRDLPLRLIAVAEHGDTGAADSAVRAAAAAVQADGRPVAVETDVLAGTPAQVLLQASRTATMVCIGAVGPRHFDHEQSGSTAAALVGSALCPVAIVRGGDRPDGSTASESQPGTEAGWVVVEPGHSPESAAVLQFAVAEARMRRAPLRVLGTWQSDGQDAGPAVRAQLDRRLEEWRHRYPDLDVVPVAVPGSGLDYLTGNAAAIQLVVVGAADTAAIGELLGPDGQAALRHADCSILVVDHQRLL